MSDDPNATQPNPVTRRATDINFPDGTPWWAKMLAYALHDLWDWLTAATAFFVGAFPMIEWYVESHPTEVAGLTQLLPPAQQHLLMGAFGFLTFFFNMMSIIRKSKS